MLNWKTEKRKINDLIPYEKNPRKISEKQIEDLKKSFEKFNLVEIPVINTDNTIIDIIGYDSIGRKRKFILKKCQYCNDYFKIPKYLLNKRKFCSQKCSGYSIGKENALKGSKQLIERNKSLEFRKKVSKGLQNYFNKNPRNKEKWYIKKYGENYKPKKLKYCNSWKKLSFYLRNKYNCQRCYKPNNLDIHHIIPYTISKDNSLFNLIVLCRSCHKIIENNNLEIFNLFKNWDIVRNCFRLNYETANKRINYIL